jgi:hypothetical protein
MSTMNSMHDICLELGKKKVFAVAVHWPGWCRFGKDEQAAVQALVDAAPRYSGIARDAGLAFTAPESASLINTMARLEGNSTTDFGAPDGQLPSDWDPLNAEELERHKKLLDACWRAFDKVVRDAAGKELRKGPRGGGRDLQKIIDHVIGAEESYLRTLGWKVPPNSTETRSMDERKRQVRSAVIQVLQAAAGGELPRKGPRGGKRWPPRFFVRRLAWHVLDHTWEIEDRTM